MRWLLGCVSAAAVLAALVPTASAETDSAEPEATKHATPPLTIVVEGRSRTCREQSAQAFLIRGNWFKGEPKSQQKMLAAAINYRTEKYGYFPGFGSPKLNAHAPKHYAESVQFLGLSLSVNKHIIPALKCVEAALHQGGFDAGYHPQSGSGIRFANTYRGSEISNHVYGIAVDIEPNANTCCGCVAPWNAHPLCKKKGTPYDRMAMPRTWVETFERYGFYWLGHDVLQDTMHFEFLGDPDKILQ